MGQMDQIGTLGQMGFKRQIANGVISVAVGRKAFIEDAPESRLTFI
jgi:hypothetical protein